MIGQPTVDQTTGELTARPWRVTDGAAEVPRPRPAAGADGDPLNRGDLFDRVAWLYAFLREHLFRDDTDRVVAALWPAGPPPPGTVLLEVGCGPGLYARHLATRFPGLHAVGIDRAAGQLRLARARAEGSRLTNCRFERGDALALDWPDASVDAVVAARLLTVVDGPAAVAELHRVLRPGGRCFLAEPASTLGVWLPLAGLRLADALARRWSGGSDAPGTPPTGTRLAVDGLRRLAQTRSWSEVQTWSQDGYHYLVCEKPAAPGPPSPVQAARPLLPTPELGAGPRPPMSVQAVGPIRDPAPSAP